MVRMPIPKNCLKYYKVGYSDGWEECILRLRRLGVPEDYLKKLTVKHKHRLLIVYFDIKRCPVNGSCMACIRRYECRRIAGYTGNDYLDWDSTFYIRKDLGRIGKAMTFFHELFHWVLTWIEYRKQRYIFPEEFKDCWDNLWSLHFGRAIRNLTQVAARASTERERERK